MSEYQRIVDELRLYLQAEDCEVTDEMTELVGEYSEAAKEVNARLRRCGQFLSQNLRSEAIQLANTEPNLLDTVACLDFPEKERLSDIIRLHGLRLEPLMLEVAEELNEAYAIEQPLQKLLDKNRLLALARAPLNKRLEVLREISEQDSDSVFWQDDVREFELARQQEIVGEVQRAAEKGDANRLRALRHEMRDTAWLEPPPDDLSKEVVKRSNQAARKISQNKLSGLAEALMAAYSGEDLTRTRAFAREWREAVKQAGLPPNDAMALSVEPALEWIRKADTREASDNAFKREVALLERAIETGQPADEVQRRAAKVQATGRHIPPELEERLQLCETRMARKKLIVMVATVVGLIILAVGLIIFVRSLNQGSDKKGSKSATSIQRDDVIRPESPQAIQT